MLQVQHEIAYIRTCIQALPTVVRNSAGLECQDLPYRIVLCLTSIAPHSDPNTDTALVSDDDTASLSLVAVLQIKHASLSNLKDHANHINSALLNDLLDRIEPREGEAVTLDGCIVPAFLNCSSVVQRQTVIVFDRCVSLVR